RDDLSRTSAFARQPGQSITDPNVENRLEFGRGDPHHSTRQNLLTNTDTADADVNAYRDPATGGADATNDNRRISRVR
ncbi:MAG TPA: hypothetical protein VMW65_04700, partial [Chloroflexota bacterium]|nr:hypothetical protein [Chloroflexota bacterium]